MGSVGRNLIIRVLGVLALLVGSAVLAVPAQAADPALPFADANAQGFIGLCDKSGHPVTSGKTTDIPFVWRAVSSTPAPKSYVGPLGKVTLAIYQPRQNVNSGEWSGKQFTGSTSYSNVQHPMAQSTYLDPPLVDLTSIAPLWDGLLQLRLIYSNVNAVPHLRPYPATVIKVTGGTWTVVSGGSVSCTDGTGVSDEVQQLPASSIPTVAPTLIGGTEAPQIVGTGAPSTSETGATVNLALASSTGSKGFAGISTGVFVALIVLPVLGVGLGFVVARRRPATRTPD